MTVRFDAGRLFLCTIEKNIVKGVKESLRFLGVIEELRQRGF
jgi:hypothetical protein